MDLLKKLAASQAGKGALEPYASLVRGKRWPVWVWGAVLGLVFLGVGALSAWLRQPLANPPAQPASAGMPGSETISTAALGLDVVFKLGIVVLLIYASLYLLKRLQAGTAPRSRKRLSILETARLSPRQALHLVQVGDQVLLIGATDQSVTCLLEVEGAMQSIKDAGIEQVEESALSLANESKPIGLAASAPLSFAAFLSNAFGKR